MPYRDEKAVLIEERRKLEEEKIELQKKRDAFAAQKREAKDWLAEHSVAYRKFIRDSRIQAVIFTLACVVGVSWLLIAAFVGVTLHSVYTEPSPGEGTLDSSEPSRETIERVPPDYTISSHTRRCSERFWYEMVLTEPSFVQFDWHLYDAVHADLCIWRQGNQEPLRCWVPCSGMVCVKDYDASIGVLLPGRYRYRVCTDQGEAVPFDLTVLLWGRSAERQ